MIKSGLELAYKERGENLRRINEVSPWHKLYRLKTWPLIKEHTRNKQLTIMDAGCGPGIFSIPLLKMGHKVHFVDKLQDMLDMIKKELDKLPYEFSNNANTFLHPIEHITSLLPNSCDFIICSQVINFCNNLDTVLDEFNRLLKKNGKLLIDVDPAYRWILTQTLMGRAEGAKKLLENNEDIDKHIINAEYYFWSKAKFESALDSCGFSIERQHGIGFMTPYIHIFAESQEFLNIKNIPIQAQEITNKGNLELIFEMEEKLSGIMPLECAGWAQYMCSKR